MFARQLVRSSSLLFVFLRVNSAEYSREPDGKKLSQLWSDIARHVNANPNGHVVTVHIEPKAVKDTIARYAVELENVLLGSALSRADFFSPSDLRARQPRAASLVDAANMGWPTVGELQVLKCERVFFFDPRLDFNHVCFPTPQGRVLCVISGKLSDYEAERKKEIIQFVFVASRFLIKLNLFCNSVEKRGLQIRICNQWFAFMFCRHRRRRRFDWATRVLEFRNQIGRVERMKESNLTCFVNVFVMCV